MTLIVWLFSLWVFNVGVGYLVCVDFTIYTVNECLALVLLYCFYVYSVDIALGFSSGITYCFCRFLLQLILCCFLCLCLLFMLCSRFDDCLVVICKFVFCFIVLFTLMLFTLLLFLICVEVVVWHLIAGFLMFCCFSVYYVFCLDLLRGSGF